MSSLTADQNTLAVHETARFRTTHWSRIQAAGNPHSPDCEDALAALCRTYWFPLYAYARGCGRSPEDAQDVTQAFFTNLLETGCLARADRERGRFRWFLLTSFQNFLRNDLTRSQAQKRGGHQTVVSWDALDAEQRYIAEPVDAAAPDVLFDRRWARSVMHRALDRLGDEFSRTSRQELFGRLKVFLVGDSGDSSYAALASELGLTAVAVKVTIHRLRRRYGELIRSEITHTVADPDDVEGELRHLAQMLSA